MFDASFLPVLIPLSIKLRVYLLPNFYWLFIISFFFYDAFLALISLTGTPSVNLVIPLKSSSSRPKMKIGGPVGVAGISVLLLGEKLINLAL
jgi:hypothetical protein